MRWGLAGRVARAQTRPNLASSATFLSNKEFPPASGCADRRAVEIADGAETAPSPPGGEREERNALGQP